MILGVIIKVLNNGNKLLLCRSNEQEYNDIKEGNIPEDVYKLYAFGKIENLNEIKVRKLVDAVHFDEQQIKNRIDFALTIREEINIDREFSKFVCFANSEWEHESALCSFNCALSMILKPKYIVIYEVSDEDIEQIQQDYMYNPDDKVIIKIENKVDVVC